MRARGAVPPSLPAWLWRSADSRRAVTRARSDLGAWPLPPLSRAPVRAPAVHRRGRPLAARRHHDCAEGAQARRGGARRRRHRDGGAPAAENLRARAPSSASGGKTSAPRALTPALPHLFLATLVRLRSRRLAAAGTVARPRSQLSKHLREVALTHTSKSQLFIKALAKALEVIPRQLCANAGFDATDVLNLLRQKHAAADGSGRNFGVDVNTGGVVDTFEAFVWEPTLVKMNAIKVRKRGRGWGGRHVRRKEGQGREGGTRGTSGAHPMADNNVLCIVVARAERDRGGVPDPVGGRDGAQPQERDARRAERRRGQRRHHGARRPGEGPRRARRRPRHAAVTVRGGRHASRHTPHCCLAAAPTLLFAVEALALPQHSWQPTMVDAGPRPKFEFERREILTSSFRSRGDLTRAGTRPSSRPLDQLSHPSGDPGCGAGGACRSGRPMACRSSCRASPRFVPRAQRRVPTDAAGGSGARAIPGLAAIGARAHWH